MPDPKTHTLRREERERKVKSINFSPLPPPYPGVLPLVGHGDYISVEEMFPVLGIATPPARFRRLRLVRISLHP